MDQLSLVFFTVLAQAAVGLFIVLGLVRLFAAQEYDSTLIDKGFLAVWPLFGLALMISMTHLGQPLRAFNVLFGIAHGSALSLEILASMIFGGIGFLYTLTSWFKLGSQAIRSALLLLAMLAGVTLVLAISNVYSLATVPAWSSIFTPLQFLATMAVLGCLATAVVISFSEGQTASGKLTFLTSLALLAVITIFPAYLVYLTTESLVFSGYHIQLSAIRLLLLALGGGLCLFSLLKSDHSNHLRTGLAGTGFMLALMSEFASRILFYDMYFTTGM